MVNRSSSQDPGFESLAGVTGAEFVRLTASPQAAVSRLLRETAAYYTATFDPDRRNATAARSASSCSTTREKVKLRTRPVGRDREGHRQGRGVARRTCCARRRRTPICRCAPPATRRGSPGSDEVKVMALFEAVDPSAALKDASVGALRREEHAEEAVDGAGRGTGKRARSWRRSRRRRHLSRPRRRGRRVRPRRDDRLRAEGGSAARGPAEAEHAGARDAAAGRRVRAAPGVLRRADRHRVARDLRRAEGRHRHRGARHRRRRRKARRSRPRRRPSAPGDVGRHAASRSAASASRAWRRATT